MTGVADEADGGGRRGPDLGAGVSCDASSDIISGTRNGCPAIPVFWGVRHALSSLGLLAICDGQSLTHLDRLVNDQRQTLTDSVGCGA